MIIKEEIAKIEGLAKAVANEIEGWFERHFSPGATSLNLEQAKADLHEVLGTPSVPVVPETPVPAADSQS